MNVMEKVFAILTLNANAMQVSTVQIVPRTWMVVDPQTAHSQKMAVLA